MGGRFCIASTRDNFVRRAESREARERRVERKTESLRVYSCEVLFRRSSLVAAYFCTAQIHRRDSRFWREQFCMLIEFWNGDATWARGVSFYQIPAPLSVTRTNFD